MKNQYIYFSNHRNKDKNEFLVGDMIEKKLIQPISN